MSRDPCELYNTKDVKYDCPLGNSDHKVVLASPTSTSGHGDSHTSTDSTRLVYDFRRSNIDYLYRAASQIDWTKVQTVTEGNDVVQ